MKDKDFQQLVDREFAQLEWTDVQRMDTLRKMKQKEAHPMKRKFTIALIIVAILVTTSVTAVAAGLAIPSLQDFFDRDNNYEYIFGVPPEAYEASAIASPIEQQHTCTLVDLHADQLYMTAEKLYFTVHYTPKDENTFLFSGTTNSVTLDGQEVPYWRLWDTDYSLFFIFTPQLNDPQGNDPYRPTEHVSSYRDPETGTITNLYAFPYTDKDLMLHDPLGGTLTLYCQIEDLRKNEGERFTLVIDFPPLTVVNFPDPVRTHE